MATPPAPNPPMSTPTTTAGADVLSTLLSSRVRAAVLGMFAAREGERFSLTELARALDLSISSVQHECYKLERLHVLTGRREGVSRRYGVNRETPLVAPLMDLVVTVLGRERLLGHALAGLDGLQGALYASDPARLILIGDLGLEALEVVQDRAGFLLGIGPDAIDIALYGTAAWQEHLAGDSALVSGLRQGAPLVIAGDPAGILPA